MMANLPHSASHSSILNSTNLKYICTGTMKLIKSISLQKYLFLPVNQGVLIHKKLWPTLQFLYIL